MVAEDDDTDPTNQEGGGEAVIQGVVLGDGDTAYPGGKARYSN